MAEAERGVVEQPGRGDDRAGAAGGLCIDAQGVMRLEIEVALDAEPEPALDAFELAQADGAELGAAEPEIGQAEQDVGPVWSIGRASCRERVCQYVSISVVAVSLKKTTKQKNE